MNQIEPQLFFQTANYTAIVACGSCPDLFSCQHYQVLDFYLTNQRTGKRVGRRYGCFRCPMDFDAVTRLVEHLFTVHFVACRLLCRYCWPPPLPSSSSSSSSVSASPRAPHQLFESISQLACHFRYNHQEPQWDTDWVALWVEERRRQKSVLSEPFVELLQQEKHNNGNNNICNQMMTWESRKGCYCCCCCSSSSSGSTF